MVDKRFGEHIKKCRCDLGLTQQEFAERVGLSTGYISALEQGKSFPSYEKLIHIINGLETSADHIFGDLLDHNCYCRSSEVTEKLVELPADCQRCILAIMELLIDLANKNLELKREI